MAANEKWTSDLFIVSCKDGADLMRQYQSAFGFCGSYCIAVADSVEELVFDCQIKGINLMMQAFIERIS